VSKAQSPLLGFNNNVKHRGRMFHIQTEDSGIKYPHIITHLFADGGRILKSTKTSYAEYIGSENLRETVRNLMQEQHKSMFIALRDGQFDHLIDETMDEKRGSGEQGKGAAEPEPSVAVPESAQGPISSAVLDVEVLERAAASVQSRSPLFGGEDMPPPPPTVLPTQKPSGSYRAVGVGPSSQATDKNKGHYSAPRPASIFGTASVSESSKTVFGEDVISSKSLDEVIMDFLSEEFDTSSNHEGDEDSDKRGRS